MKRPSHRAITDHGETDFLRDEHPVIGVIASTAAGLFGVEAERLIRNLSRTLKNEAA